MMKKTLVDEHTDGFVSAENVDCDIENGEVGSEEKTTRTITVTRAKRFKNAAIALEVYCDDVYCFTLKNGRSDSFEVDFAPHVVMAKAEVKANRIAYSGMVDPSKIHSNPLEIPAGEADVPLHLTTAGYKSPLDLCVEEEKHKRRPSTMGYNPF